MVWVYRSSIISHPAALTCSSLSASPAIALVLHRTAKHSFTVFSACVHVKSKTFYLRCSISCSGYRVRISICLPPVLMTRMDPDSRAVIALSLHNPLLSVTMNRPNVSSCYDDASHHSRSITLMININSTKCNLFDFYDLRMKKRGPAASLV